MGNKEGKFKKVFEEIDASGDGSVSLDELEKFLGAKYLVSFFSRCLKKEKNGLVLLTVFPRMFSSLE